MSQQNKHTPRETITQQLNNTPNQIKTNKETITQQTKSTTNQRITNQQTITLQNKNTKTNTKQRKKLEHSKSITQEATPKQIRSQ